MTNFDFRRYRLREDGEAYRRLHVYITQVDSVIHHIETCEPFSDMPSESAMMADLIGFLDVYRDGSCILSINFEGHDTAILDLAKQFKSMIRYDLGRDDGRYVFAHPAERTAFQLLCGG